MYWTQVITPPANLSESQIEKVITIHLLKWSYINDCIICWLQISVESARGEELCLHESGWHDLQVRERKENFWKRREIINFEGETKNYKFWKRKEKLQIVKEKKKYKFPKRFHPNLSKLSEFNRTDINSYLFYFFAPFSMVSISYKK